MTTATTIRVAFLLVLIIGALFRPIAAHAGFAAKPNQEFTIGMEILCDDLRGAGKVPAEFSAAPALQVN